MGSNSARTLPDFSQHFAKLPDKGEALTTTFPYDKNRAALRNCENLIGSVSLPVGFAGPISIEGDVGLTDMYIPLATTEGTLVASTNRGLKLLRSGRVTSHVRQKGVTRGPALACRNASEAHTLLSWLESRSDWIKEITEKTSGHFKLLDWTGWVAGRTVFLRLRGNPDEAMGMNMITIATDALLKAIVLDSPVKITRSVVSANVCVDKKPAASTALFGRGWWCQVDTIISSEAIAKVLHVSTQALWETYWQKNQLGSQHAFLLGNNSQVANVAAAFFLATGQDPAHVVEASHASLVIEPEGDGLFVSLTIPALLLGTIGGGTWFPAQVAARSLIAKDSVSSKMLAVAVTTAALGAELSLLGALAKGELAKAHARTAQGRELE